MGHLAVKRHRGWTACAKTFKWGCESLPSSLVSAANGASGRDAAHYAARRRQRIGLAVSTLWGFPSPFEKETRALATTGEAGGVFPSRALHFLLSPSRFKSFQRNSKANSDKPVIRVIVLLSRRSLTHQRRQRSAHGPFLFKNQHLFSFENLKQSR